MTKQIYRGYDIEEQEGGLCWVTKNDGEGRHFQNYAAACDWIDAEKRAASKVKAGGQ